MSSYEKYEDIRPEIIVFAGPNGSGKSTITMKLPVTGVYVNADRIKITDNCTDMEAALKAEKIREMLLAAGRSFTFETVLSTGRNLNLLKRAKKAGYRIFAVVVITNNPEINIERVKQRVCSGGHDVPEEKIISRYKKSLNNIPELVQIADVTKIFDNTGNYPELICEVSENCASIYASEYWDEPEILKLIIRKKN